MTSTTGSFRKINRRIDFCFKLKHFFLLSFSVSKAPPFLLIGSIYFVIDLKFRINLIAFSLANKTKTCSFSIPPPPPGQNVVKTRGKQLKTSVYVYQHF